MAASEVFADKSGVSCTIGRTTGLAHIKLILAFACFDKLDSFNTTCALEKTHHNIIVSVLRLIKLYYK